MPPAAKSKNTKKRRGSPSKRAESPEQNYEVEQVLNKKVHKDQTYYQLKWAGCEEPTWEPESLCNCDELIKDYEKRIKLMPADEDEDEWEVEKILDKRMLPDSKVEYLVKWKNWDGDNQWINEEDCLCINLIAAYENPKLRRLWNFRASNPNLWLDQEEILGYIKNLISKKKCKANVLNFEKDFPEDEQAFDLEDGINIGPLCYKDHWYLVIILMNHICVSSRLLVGDPMNTLLGVSDNRTHPVFKRLTRVYPRIPLKPVTMTPMDRSDMSSYYLLAAVERALFVYNRKATFIAEKLFFDFSKPELIRAKLRPDSNDEFSIALPVSSAYLTGPRCEFCGDLFETDMLVEKHIKKEHFR